MIKNWLRNIRDKIFGINKLEFRIDKKAKEYSDFKFKELKAMEILKPYFPKGFVFETSYTLSFQVIQHIANDIIINKPQTILEIGSGLSTIILSNLISELNYGPNFISIDQDFKWQNHIKPHCKEVEFYNFEITKNKESTIEGSWFNIPKDSFLREKKFDMVIIDGPKGFESKYARYGIIDFLKGRVMESTIVFLDDTDREDEQFILQNLKDKLSFKFCNSFYKYSRLTQTNLIVTSPS